MINGGGHLEKLSGREPRRGLPAARALLPDPGMPLASALVLLATHVLRVGPDPRDRPPPPPAAPAPAPITAFREVVGAGRGMIGETALTLPPRHAELSLRVAPTRLALAELGLGVTRSTAVWGDAGLGLGDASTTVYGVGIKQAILRTPQVHLALTSSLRWIDDGGFGQFGGVVTACDEDCSLAATFGASALFERNVETQAALTLALSAGSATRRFLVDLFLLDRAKWALIGVRIGSARVAVDAGVLAQDEGGEPYAAFVASASLRL